MGRRLEIPYGERGNILLDGKGFDRMTKPGEFLHGEIEVCAIGCGGWVIRREWAPNVPWPKVFEYLAEEEWLSYHYATVFSSEQEARAYLAAFILCQ